MGASKHGTFSWCELLTTDVEGAKKFYAELLGWTTEAVTHECEDSDENFEYNLVKVDGAEIGGIMAVPAQAQGMPPTWGTYVTVDDVDAAAVKVQDLGGKVIVPLNDIPGVGRFCVIQDPQGAVLTLITYLPGHE
ncbi:MAG: VOC family protein [Deltaproteobacteria bacterium]|nr:VOC family protein [Deltaproteobacteria bacterium]